jgi:predicted nucleotidyltransferase
VGDIVLYSNYEIMQFVSLVAEATDPDRIILFGSYAYGNPGEKSDLDFLVIKDGSDITLDEHANLSTAVWLKRKQQQIKTQYDIFFCTDRQVQDSVKNGSAFVDAIQKGKVLYERANQ